MRNNNTTHNHVRFDSFVLLARNDQTIPAADSKIRKFLLECIHCVEISGLTSFFAVLHVVLNFIFECSHRIG